MEHPAERYEESVQKLRSRATLATAALAVSMLLDAYDIAARLWSISLLRAFEALDGDSRLAQVDQLSAADQVVNVGQYAAVVLLVVTATLFLRWVHLIVRLSGQVGSGYPAWTPSQAVWAFIIPVVSLYRPYQVLSNLETEIDPDGVDPPAPRVDRSVDVGDYRSTPFVTPPPPKAVPRALIGFWWGTYAASNVVTRIASASSRGSGIDAVVTSYEGYILASALSLVAAVLAINVVRGLTARLEERFRRIRHSPPEALELQRIVLRETA